VPTVRLVDSSALPACDVVVVGTLSTNDGIALAPGAAPVDECLGGRLLEALRVVGAKGRADEVVKVPTLGRADVAMVVATGLGPQDASALDPESVRRALGAALRTLSTSKQVAVALATPTDASIVGAIIEGALLGNYAFGRYKSASPTSAVRRLSIMTPDPKDKLALAAVRRSQIIAEAVTATRDLINTAPNDLYPSVLADHAVRTATAAGLDVEVLDERALRRGGYGGILGVGSGSQRPPRLVRIAYRPRGAHLKVALIGKGITFDSGGLNIKTTLMDWMKSDMSGAAAVISTMAAVAALKLPIEVVATVPMAENMPSGTAYRPSDVLTMFGGKTVEVGNTDAEGRLILADAIVRAAQDEPDFLLETSTLTGAQMIALGSRVSAVMGSDELCDLVVNAGARAGEAVWRMPLIPELRPGLDSAVADLQNVAGDRWGGMLVAGHFLSEFVPAGLEWVHLDIAGPAWNPGGPHGYTSKGGTGVIVRTLISSLEMLAARA
jgi:leucyl aminopeptidase